MELVVGTVSKYILPFEVANTTELKYLDAKRNTNRMHSNKDSLPDTLLRNLRETGLSQKKKKLKRDGTTKTWKLYVLLLYHR